MPDRAFGMSHEVNSNQHNIKINQTLIRDLAVLCLVLKKEINEMRKEIDTNTERLNYIYDYTVKKKEREDAKWF